MQTDDIEVALRRTGYPVAYDFFTKPPTTPFIAYRLPRSNNVFADGTAYLHVSALVIELATDRKSLVAEATLGRELETAGIAYQKSEMFIDNERLHVVTYESEVIIND